MILKIIIKYSSSQCTVVTENITEEMPFSVILNYIRERYYIKEELNNTILFCLYLARKNYEMSDNQTPVNRYFGDVEISVVFF